MTVQVLPTEYHVEKGYARGVVAGGFVFLSGVGGIDPDSDTVLPTMAEQAGIICRRIVASLELAGSSVENIVKIVTYVTDLNIYRSHGAAIVKERLPRRASTLVVVKQLARPGMMIEVDVTAAVEAGEFHRAKS
ncbi:MAG: RidA family protein [Deltaproteobacteria bacterium]|nr:RidA family protein [Deltaproteobacteria bacterium]